jgi:hypothetical protein
MTPNADKLAEALRVLAQKWRGAIAVAATCCHFGMRDTYAICARDMEEALAEHDAQPAPGESDHTTCHVAPHTGSGYLHDPEHMGPYDVDGVTYCGRCHVFISTQPAPAPVQVECSAQQPPSAEAVYGIIDPDYARVFTSARCIAWSEGYALLMHGSFTRDLDLLAVPWTDKACEPEHLARRIESSRGLKLAHASPCEKSHGRLAWTLRFDVFGDPRFIDLSIMPRLENPPAPAADGAGELPPLPHGDAFCDIADWSEESIGMCGAWSEHLSINSRYTMPLYTESSVRTYARAAIAALRQPVPDAVRELPGKWRERALSHGNLATDLDALGLVENAAIQRDRSGMSRGFATELESALASQQGSRNAD